MRRAVQLQEILPQYRNYPVLGRGVTSVVLQDTDPDHVLILTKDEIKAEWLRLPFGLGLGQYLEEYTATRHRRFHLNGLTITVLRMPKLRPLTRSERAGVAKWTSKVWVAFDVHKKQRLREKNSENTAKAMAADYMADFLRTNDVFKECPFREQLADVFDFLINYEDWVLDLHGGNLMMDTHNNIVITDPIVSKKLLDMVFTQHSL